MRPHTATTMLLLALASCKRSSPDAPDPVGSAGAEAPSALTSAGVSELAAPMAKDGGVRSGPAEPVPGQYGRYFIDMRRFSATYPVSPEMKVFPPPRLMTGLEAHLENGTAFVVMCGPTVAGASNPERERAQTVGDGKLLSESHPSFYGGEAYEVHATLKAGGERFMRFITYAGRFCSVGVEMGDNADEAQATRFIESFRPEPPP